MGGSAAGRFRVAVGAALLLLLGCANGHPASKAGSPATPEQSELERIAAAFRAFHQDTGGWPMGHSVWFPGRPPAGVPRASSGVQIEPTAFASRDAALFQLPAGWKACAEGVARPCWNGPYLHGASLADPAYLDGWGRPRLYLLGRPHDGLGGGVASAPSGTVVIWSAGPDGRDGFGCSDASCARNWDRMGRGLSSLPGADDLPVVVGTAE